MPSALRFKECPGRSLGRTSGSHLLSAGPRAASATGTRPCRFFLSVLSRPGFYLPCWPGRGPQDGGVGARPERHECPDITTRGSTSLTKKRPDGRSCRDQPEHWARVAHHLDPCEPSFSTSAAPSASIRPLSRTSSSRSAPSRSWVSISFSRSPRTKRE